MSVGAVGGLPPLPQVPTVSGTAPAGPKDAAGAFGDMVTNGLENLQEVQGQADKFAQQAYDMISSPQANRPPIASPSETAGLKWPPEMPPTA